jgi:hypothetical protein
MVNATVAITIRQQIGADSWLAVSGRDPRYWTSDNGEVTFAFRFGSTYGLPRWCEITYKRGSDDYTIHAYKIHRNGVRKTLSVPSDYEPDGREYTTYEGVYADRLPSLVRYINTIGELS